VGLGITVALLAVNAFFVAGEFAVTSTRRSQVEPLADGGARGAKDALYALQHVSLMLAICQLGVTVASTTLGVVAEPAIAHLVESPLERPGAPEATSHVVGFAVALVIVLFCHVVFGEMVPKNISIAAPVRMLLILAPVLVRLGHVLRPIIEAMDHFANWFVRLSGYEPRSEISASYTVEEVASIVVASQEEGVLTDELGLLSGTLEFSEETAGSAMVPLADLVTLPDGATPADVEQLDNYLDHIDTGLHTEAYDGTTWKQQADQRNIKKGDLLIEFDEAAIRAAGYDTTTPVVVTNAADYGTITLSLGAQKVSSPGEGEEEASEAAAPAAAERPPPGWPVPLPLMRRQHPRGRTGIRRA